VFATIFFLIGRYKYNNPKKYKAFEKMQQLLDENKMHLFEERQKAEKMEKLKTKQIIEAVEEVKKERFSRSMMVENINGSYNPLRPATIDEAEVD
jgi:hypothetical protein